MVVAEKDSLLSKQASSRTSISLILRINWESLTRLLLEKASWDQVFLTADDPNYEDALAIAEEIE